MTDRELLERAAKAARIDAKALPDYEPAEWGLYLNGTRSPDNSCFWNPLTDDGDALRLAVKLSLNIYFDIKDRFVACGADECIFYDESKFGRSSDPYAATRRAVVRAAAEMEPKP